MNILIADDEYLARASLKSMLMELDMDINIVGEARDGEELIQKVLITRPDLVFADIKMPKSDGLSAIKQIKEQGFNTEWIILTGFPVFEYAKESLELHVKKYLLKPVSKDELKASIEYVLAEKAGHQQKLNLEFEHDISALINHYMDLEDLQSGNVILSYHFMGAVLLLDGYINNGKPLGFQQDFWNQLSALKSKIIDTEIRIAIIPNPSGNFLAVFAWNFSESADRKTKAEHFIQQLINTAKQMSNNNYYESVIHGTECADFSQLSRQLEQIQELIPLKMSFSYGNSIRLDDLKMKRSNTSSQAMKTAELLNDITNQYKVGSYYECIKSIEQLKYYLSVNRVGIDALMPFSNFFLGSYNIDLSSCSLESVFDTLKHLAENRFNSSIRSGDIVDQTICFINNYYMKDIGIAQIANQLNVTPNYLSMLFRKKTGENFIDYLTKTRMTRARELLLSADNPHIGQISRQVGYYTVSYFTRLYKKYFGLSPSQDFIDHQGLETPSARAETGK